MIFKNINLLLNIPIVYSEGILMIYFCFSEQCHNLISSTYKTSCKTGQGLDDMFLDIAHQLVECNRSKIELQRLDHNSFKISQPESPEEPPCSC